MTFKQQHLLPSSLILFVLFAVACSALLASSNAYALGLPTITFGVDDANTPQQVSTALQVLFVLTIISVAPAILLMTTCFTRIVIVLGFVRQAMGTQNMPPTQVILGLSLFLSFFVMSPTLNKINEEALQPYMNEQIDQAVALQKAVAPMRDFMFSQVREDELTLLTRNYHESGADRQKRRTDHDPYPGFYVVRTKKGLSNGVHDLYSFSGHRYDCCIHPYVHGHDDAPPGDNFHAVQAVAFCSRRWLESGRRLAHQELFSIIVEALFRLR